MIYEIYTSRGGFKRFRFTPHLNIVLAVSGTEGGSQIANSVGKSSLIELIYFMTGGNHSENSPLKDPLFKQDVATMVLDAHPDRPTIKRLLGKQDVTVTDLGTPGPVEMKRDEWRDTLTERWFGVPSEGFDLGSDEPTGGRLMKFVVRMQRAGGFEKADKSWKGGRLSQSSAAMAYLLGLPWQPASGWGSLKDREKAIKSLNDLDKAGVRFVQRVFGDAETLREELASLDQSISELEQALAQRSLGETETQVASRADELQRRVREAGDLLSENRRATRAIERALSEHTDEARAREFVAALPSSLGDLVTRRLDEVEQFRAAVVANRVTYLAETRQRLEGERGALEARHKALMEELRTEMEGLSTQSVWQGFEEQARVLAKRNALRQTLLERIEAIEALADQKSAIAAEKRLVKETMETALAEARPRVEYLDREFKAIVREALGNDVLKAEFVLKVTDDRLAIDPDIETGGGLGVGNMAIWALDLLTKHMERQLGFHCGVLVHDSHLFDPIDKDRVPFLLRTAKRRAEAEGWQYIVTLNRSDLRLDDRDADLLSSVNPVQLDDSAEGGLFGVRFG